MALNKNEAFLTFLQTCPTIQNNPMFFNFGTAEDSSTQVNIESNDVSLNHKHIDGSELKRYTCSVDSCKSITYLPVVGDLSAENVDDFKEVQDLLDWLNEQGERENFPDFGDKCMIESMKSVTEEPMFMGVNQDTEPPIAVYRVTIQIDYLDISKVIWN